MRPPSVVTLTTFLVAMSVLVPGAQAQSFTPSLDLTMAAMPSEALVPGGQGGNFTVHWVYTFKETPTAALAAGSEGTTLYWDPAPVCDLPGFVVSGATTTTITFAGPATVPPPSHYEGDVNFYVAADATAAPKIPVKCAFQTRTDEVSPNINAATSAPVMGTVVALAPTATDANQAKGQSESKDAPVGVSLETALALLGACAIAARRKR